MNTRWARFVRGWIVAVFSTFVAALSHTLGGAAAPGWLSVVVSLAFAGMVCVFLAGRVLSFWRSAASVLISQVIFHGLFAFGAPGGVLTADAGAAPGVHQHAELTMVVDPGVLTAGTHGGHAGATMWAAHLGAAVVTIIALRFAEGAFWGLLKTVRLGMRTLFTPVWVSEGVRSPRRIRHEAPLWSPRNLILVLSAMRHRGPPAVALCA